MEFTWTDENVKEFIGKYFNTSAPVIGGKNLEVLLSYFKHKKSKEPKREYEILSYTFQKRVYNKNNFGEFCCGFDVPVQSLLLHPEYMKTIYSVKRLSDGEIFTVGDDYGSSKIEGFKIDTEFNGGLCAISHKGSALSSLYSLEKVKQPLFTTEDGKPVYLDQRIWWVRKSDFELDFHDFYKGESHYPDRFLYFSTKEAAEDYILMNKPVHSVNDIMKLCDPIKFHNRNDRSDEDYSAIYVSVLAKKLIELAKTKLTNP